MVTETDIKKQDILREHKVTLYRLHPTEFGAIMVMPNLPFGLRERDRYLNEKGYKRTPQELMPEAEVKTNDAGELFLVPKGYELKSLPDKALLGDGKTFKDISVWQVTKCESSFPCPECGKSCVSDFGLQSHMKSHK